MNHVSNKNSRYWVYARTLTFLFNEDDVLLIKRSPNAHLFPGLYNAVGGRIERGEDVLSAAQREVREETGLEGINLTLRGILHADEGDHRPGVIIFIFAGFTQHRDVTASGEGTLHWMPINEVYGEGFLPDLPDILPRIPAPSHNDRPFFARSRISEETDIWDIQFVD